MAHSHSHPHGLAHQFDDLNQQHESASLGMWAFLVTEVMFFGGLFLAYTFLRWKHHDAVVAASGHLDWILGGVNTAVLLISSLTMAMAVHAAQEGKRKATVNFLIVTIILGAVFLGVKAFEYSHKWHDALFPGFNFLWTENPAHAGGAEMFLFLYFVMTGLHGLHMVVGIGLVAWIIKRANRGDFTPEYNIPVEITGLYWHFVDIVWIFLYPLLYLIQPPHH